jgi:hypothetical protein
MRNAGTASAASEDRYFFHDYRFRHGDVPDVLVDAAVDRKMFKHDGSTWRTEWISKNEAPFPLVEWLDEMAAPAQSFSKETIIRLEAAGRVDQPQGSN